MDLRPYLPGDRTGCLAIFDSNFPRSGRPAFEDFLATPAGPYFVMEHDAAAVGCGGYTLAQPGVATLVWGMIRKDLQRQGLGRYLLMFRLREIGKQGSIQRVHLETTQQAASFFEGQGFKIASVTGDRVEMVKKLTVCT